MNGLRVFVLALATLAAACAQESVEYAPTQVTLHVSAEPTLLEQLRELRVSVRLRESDGWTRLPVIKSYAKDTLSWPVDFPIVPRSGADDSKEFEVVIDAFGPSGALAQMRALSRFMRDDRRVLDLALFLCPKSGSPVCAEAGCVGESCSVCTRDGSCVPVSMVAGRRDERQTNETVILPPGQGDGGSISEPPSNLDGGGRSGFAPDGALAPDAAAPLDAGASLDASSGQTRVDASSGGGSIGGSIGGGGTIVDAASSQPEASVDVCAPNPCQNGGRCSRTGALCSCNQGFTGVHCETAITSCITGNLCTSTDYPCRDTPPSGYVCQGQFAEWRMPDALAGSKVAPSYDTSSADIVRDNITGLIWQRRLPNVYPGCTLTSSDNGRDPAPQAGDSCTLAEAKAYCDGLSLGGRSDWRVPSKIELESIADETHSYPAINATAFPGTRSDFYVTTSPMYGIGGNIWFVSFAMGWPGFNKNTDPARVRCVAATPAGTGTTPADRYVVNAASNTVTDTRTGLIWQSTSSTITYTWDSAKSYCAGLGMGFRLPAFKELLTLVDPNHSPPLDPKLGPGSGWNWSGSQVPELSDNVWVVNFGSGGGYFIEKTEPSYVRCVR